MPKLLHGLAAAIFCVLFASPQVYACMGPGLEYTIFFNADAQAQFIKDLGQAPPKSEGLVELPPDADIIAEIILTDERKGFLEGAATAKILRIIRTNDSRICQGEKIPVEFEFTSCGPNHRSGSTGIIVAEMGADIEDRPVLCLYSRRFSDGHINSPIGPEYLSACNPSAMEKAKQIKQAAENGDVKAQMSLSVMYESGRGVGLNNAEALKWLQVAAESGDAEALYQLGAKYRRDKHNEESLKWFKLAAEKGHENAKVAVERLQESESVERAAKNGDVEAQYKLGRKYASDVNYIEATKWYKLAALQGHIQAANKLGYIYNGGGGGVQINHREARRWYLMAAEKGDVEGQCGVGGQYEFLNNYSESLKWYKLAADQGNTRAMERLGTLYRYGRGVEQNDAEAMKWYELALERGYDYVLPSLVDMYHGGRVRVEHDATMEKWFRLSATNGYNVAQFGLGQMYQTGENVEQNDAEAITWYLLASVQGNLDAKNALAAMEQQGRGVTVNYAEVEKLLGQAGKEGIWQARAALEILRNQSAMVDK